MLADNPVTLASATQRLRPMPTAPLPTILRGERIWGQPADFTGYARFRSTANNRATQATSRISLRAMRESRRSNEISKIAADAARDSADAAVASSRAYLFPSVNDTRQDFAVNFTTTDKPHYEIQFRMVNYGSTPAVIKRIDATAFCGTRPKGAIPPLQRTKGLFGSVVLANDKSGYATVRFTISPEQKAAILAETSEIYLVAVVVFEDVFEWHHRTLFCLRFDSEKGFVLLNSSRMNRRLKPFPPGTHWSVVTDADRESLALGGARDEQDA